MVAIMRASISWRWLTRVWISFSQEALEAATDEDLVFAMSSRAQKKFNQLDTYVWARLRRFMVKRKGRNLRAGEANAWTRDFFNAHGLHQLRGTVRYPEAV